MRIPVILLGTFLILASCSGGTDQADPTIQARMEALESRLTALEKKHEQDVQALRNDMRSILQYFDIALKNADRQGTMSESLRRNWEELKRETERLLDKLQRELDGFRNPEGNQGRPKELGAS